MAQHLAVHDKQIASIRALVKEGMRLVLEDRRAMAEFRKDIRRLEKNLSSLIDALSRRNGKH